MSVTIIQNYDLFHNAVADLSESGRRLPIGMPIEYGGMSSLEKGLQALHNGISIWRCSELIN